MLGIRAMISALAVAACAASLAACGDDREGTIPTESGDRMLQLLSQVESDVEAGACDAAREKAVEFAELVSSDLPAEVDAELREEMVAASANLVELAEQQCEEPPPVGPTGETGQTDEEAPTDTGIETPEEEMPEPPEDDEGDDDQGNGRPDDTPGGGNPGGGNQGGGNSGDDDNSSGGIGGEG